MSDILTKEQRCNCMSNVRSKNTKPEIMVRKFLFSNGFRYRVNRKDLLGKLDIVLPKHKTVIFVNGCFWHGHQNCKYATIPESNREFWTAKITENIKRNEETQEKLLTLGWRVIEIWQCQLKPKTKEKALTELLSLLRNE